MKKLSKDKRNHLILVGLAAAALIAGLWFCLISYQQGRLKVAAQQIRETEKEIQKTQKVVQNAGVINTDLQDTARRLEALEAEMPAGDLYSWFISRIKQFNTASYHVEIPQVSQPVVSDVAMLPNFPYRQATVTVAGSAFYWDLGKFLADFEDRFRYARIQNLALEPGGGTGTPDDREKLSFHMDIVILLKPNTI